MLRVSGMPRIIFAFAVGAVYSVFLSEGAVVGQGGGLDADLAVGVVLLVVALGAVRIGVVSVGVGASIGLVVVLALSGSWTGAAIATLVVVVEIVYFVVSPVVARRCPVEVLFTGVEGVLVPAIGFVLVSGGWEVPWGLFAVTVPLALSVALAATLREHSSGTWKVVDVPALASPLAASILALVAGSGAVAVALAGAGLGLRPELALLASAVSVMCIFFGWLALVERRPEWRARRVAALVTASGVALSIGLIVVLLFA